MVATQALSQASQTGQPSAVGAATPHPVSLLSFSSSQQARTQVARLSNPPNEGVLWLLSGCAPGLANLPMGCGKGRLFLGSLCCAHWPWQGARNRAPSHSYLKVRNGQVQGWSCVGCGGGAGMQGSPLLGQEGPWRLPGTPAHSPLGPGWSHHMLQLEGRNHSACL